MALTPQQLAALGEQAQARLQYLRATAKVSGMSDELKRAITKARTARDKITRERKAATEGTTYNERRKAQRRQRNPSEEYRKRKEREAQIARGEREPRPLTTPEYELIQKYKRQYQFITEDFRRLPNDRRTLSIIRRTGDTISAGKKPNRRLENDYENYTGQPFPWDMWRQAYIAQKIVPWKPPEGFRDEDFGDHFAA